MAQWPLTVPAVDGPAFGTSTSAPHCCRTGNSGSVIDALAAACTGLLCLARRRRLGPWLTGALTTGSRAKLYEQSRIGTLFTDISGRLVRANPAVQRMLGRDDLVGRHLTDLVHPDDLDGPQPATEDYELDLDRRFKHTDGRVVEVSTTSTVLHDQAGNPEYVAIQVLDVTAQRALERDRQQHLVDLAERATELQRANAQVNDFIAMLSHDVRTPLTTVVNFGEIVLDEWASMAEQDKQHYVQRMTAAGHRAAGLVTEVLTLAQLDAGALVARPVRLDIAHAVREAVVAHTTVGGDRFAVTAPDETIGLADPAHLQLIVGNLLNNAAKYGAPPVEVVVINGQDDVRVEVRDAGEGVPDSFVPHLFDRFSRAASGVAITKPGTGLGLYLVVRLAEAGGLRVRYAPNRPHGARFVLHVPREPRDSASAVSSDTTRRATPAAQ